MDWFDILVEVAIKVFEKWWDKSFSGAHQTIFGHRRSIVRRIGSRLPLAQAKRVHLDLAVWRYNNEFELASNGSSTVSSITDSIDEGRGSISTETGNPAPNDDMKKLLEEILELKTKMNEILLRQSANTCCGQSSCCNIGPTHPAVVKSSNLPPPPPPPPPPPLPSPLIVLGNSTPKRSEKRIPRSNENTLRAGGLSAVLNELKTSKLTLKPVQRSPGGRPLRDSGSESGTPRSDGGGDMLAEILRRRFIQSEVESSVPTIAIAVTDHATQARLYL